MFPRPLALALAAAAFVLLALPLSAAADNCERDPSAENSPSCGGPPAPPGPGPSPPPPPPPPPPSDPYGWLDQVDGAGVATGWACDANDYTAALTIHFYADGPAGSGSFVGSAVAGELREPAVGEACGGYRAHGYSFRIPDSLRDNGTHALYAYALDVGGGGNPLLSGSPKSFSLPLPPPENPVPDGWYYEEHASEIPDDGYRVGGSCKTVLYRKTARSFAFQTVLFRMNHQLRWCWAGARITEASAVCWSSDVSWFIQASPCPVPQGQYFATDFDKQGGWFSVAQNAYRNCLPGPGQSWTCWQQATITLEIRARAGGSWTARGGGG
jgi:hypothetical protein